jgi:hypothetical protein
MDDAFANAASLNRSLHLLESNEVLSIIFPVFALLIFLFARGPASGLADRMLHAMEFASRTPIRATLLIVVTSLVISVATAGFLFWPVPSVHDEFAYVLAADTFMAGRFTNPVHPMHEHFASWHIIHEPSYQGKYPPAQGLVLAAGECLFGAKLVGVWFSYAAALLATYWAALAWLPRRWAMLATCLLLTNVPMAFAWGNSYWGGSVAMLGGSLVVGGWGRLRIASTYRWWLSGLAFGVGLGVLAASRPFEGALMALPIGIDSLYRSRSLSWSSRTWFWGIASTSAATILLALCGFHLAVTGSPFKMPYQVWTAQQGEALNRLLTPAMVLVKTDHQPVPDNSHQCRSNEMNRLTPDWRSGELANWMRIRGEQRLAFTWDKLLKTYAFYLQAVLCLPLIALPWLSSRQRGIKVMLASIGLVTIGCCLHLSAGHAHYVAGLTCQLALIVVACSRALVVFLPRLGKPLMGSICSMWLLWSLVLVAAEIVVQPHREAHAWAVRRQHIQEQLTQRGAREHRKQVVFVLYGEDHNVHREWVYNRADIDAASVVWANDLGEVSNRRLLEYYRGKGTAVESWLMLVGQEGEALVPYAAATPRSWRYD